MTEIYGIIASQPEVARDVEEAWRFDFDMGPAVGIIKCLTGKAFKGAIPNKGKKAILAVDGVGDLSSKDPFSYVVVQEIRMEG